MKKQLRRREFLKRDVSEEGRVSASRVNLSAENNSEQLFHLSHARAREPISAERNAQVKW